MTTDQVIERILSQHPEIRKEEIMRRFEKERLKTNGFISDETLLRMIAAKLGIRIPGDEILLPTLSLANLVPGLNDVMVVGRIVAVLSTKAFNRNRSGKLASLLIADKSGIVRVVLWNDKTRIVESGIVKTGEVVRVLHCHTKEGVGGVEVHSGERCSVEVNPENVNVENYPAVGEFMMKIGRVAREMHGTKANVTGEVKTLYETSAFERQDSSVGKVRRLVLADKTGEIEVVVWNEKVEELEAKLKGGTGLQIVNGRVKKALGEGLEIHVDSGTYIEAFFLERNYSSMTNAR